MGLKTKILEGLQTNLQHSELVDGKVKLVDPPTKEGSKLEILAKDLSFAIRDFIQEQTFTVVDLEASQFAVATTPNLIPKITVSVKDTTRTSPKSDNAFGGGQVESMKSKVQLVKIAKGSMD